MGLRELVTQWNARSKHRRIGRAGCFLYIGNKLYRYRGLLAERARNGTYHMATPHNRNEKAAVTKAERYLRELGAKVERSTAP